MDYKLYRGNFKGLLFIAAFKLSNYFTSKKIMRILGFPIRLMYKFCINWVLGIDIPDTTKIGKNLIVWHGIGLIIHPQTIIGNNVVLRHNTTIGTSSSNGKPPIIGNNCNIGANSVIIGEIIIGDNSIIGAGSVVIKDVEPFTVVAGNPAVKIREIKKI